MTSDHTILVVDDHVTLARAFALALKDAGYHVHVAFSAEDGVHLAQHSHFDAIVVDLRMPFINGAGFLYRLRELHGYAATPVMVVTGASVDEEVRSELSDLGAVIRFKPLGVRELLSEIGSMLEPPSYSHEAPRPVAD